MPSLSKISSPLLLMLLPWLYFMSVQINTATMPKFIHWILSKEQRDISLPQSLSLSAKVYGNMCGIDSLFTFFSVNLIGCLSDYTRLRRSKRKGWLSNIGKSRKPYMFLASFGLGISHLILLHASSENLKISTETAFYIAAAVDGLTSCMLSQAQAHIADCSPLGADLSSSLSRFQGIAIGSAFLLGIPLGAQIAHRYSLRAPLLLSSFLCALNCLLISTVLPVQPALTITEREASNSLGTEILDHNDNDNYNDEGGEGQEKAAASIVRAFWLSANPAGAAVMLSRSRALLSSSLTYLFVCVAQVRVTVLFMLPFMQCSMFFSTFSLRSCRRECRAVG